MRRAARERRAALSRCHTDAVFHADPDDAATSAEAPAVLLVDLEPSVAALFAEWLAEAGLRAVIGTPGTAGSAAAAVAVLDLPFPRQGGRERVAQLAGALPGRPVVALSPTFHAGIASRGEVARQLGVHGVVAAPARRDALLHAVRAALGST